MNKKIGNDFEAELCDILAENGYWAHNFAQNKAGQPADIIAAKNRKTVLIDCKVCSDGVFKFDRIEENQRRAMQLWHDCGNSDGWFALKIPGERVFMFMLPFLLDLETIMPELKEEDIVRLGFMLEEWL